MAGVDAEYAQRLSYELDRISTRGEFLRAAAESVDALVPQHQGFKAVTAVSWGFGAVLGMR